MDVVGRAELKGDFSLNADEESPFPWYTDVLVQSFLLVNGISRRKNPWDGSSNFISNPFELPVIERNYLYQKSSWKLENPHPLLKVSFSSLIICIVSKRNNPVKAF